MKGDFDSNLPWFVNETLPPEEMAEMRQHIEVNAEAAAKLEAYRWFSEHLKTAWKPDPVEAAGLERTLRAIQAQTVEAAGLELTLRAVQAQTSTSNETFWHKFRGHLRRVGITPTVAGIAAMIVIAVQTTLIVVMERQLSDIQLAPAEYRSTTADTGIGPFIRISFRPDTREFDIRMLFVGLGASYVGGPSQLGDYYVYVPREHVDRVVVQLRASQYVESAVLVARVPASK